MFSPWLVGYIKVLIIVEACHIYTCDTIAQCDLSQCQSLASCGLWEGKGFIVEPITKYIQDLALSMISWGEEMTCIHSKPFQDDPHNQSINQSTLFPYNYKTQYIYIYTYIQQKFRQRTKATLYGGVIKRPEHDYP